MRVVFYVLYFSKERNHLITGKKKIEEQWWGLGLGLGLFFVLYFLCCIFHVVFFVLYFPHRIYILNIEITLTMQAIAITKETTEKSWSDKTELKTKSQQTIEEK